MEGGLPATLDSDIGRHILGHLDVRRKLYLGVFSVSLVIGFPLAGMIIDWLLEADGYVPDGVQVIILQPMEVILLQLRIASQIAIILTLAVITVDLSLVGLRSSSEYIKSGTVRFSVTGGLSGILFVIFMGALGLTYAHEILIPFLLEYLAEDSAASGLNSTWQLQKWVGFITGLYFSSVIGFLVPLLVIALLRTDAIDRSLITENRSVIWFSALFLGALISPPDPISLFLVGGPILVLIELALLYDSAMSA